MAAPRVKRCVDCVSEGVTTKRKLATKRGGALQPGPRCSTHWRARRTQTRDTAWEKRLIAVYNITAVIYWAIYEFQGRRCYICRRATGIRKRLSVDHCHKTGIVRGLLCGPCNRDVLGHLRDDPDALIRAANYLLDPPAVAAVGAHRVPDLTMNGDAA